MSSHPDIFDNHGNLPMGTHQYSFEEFKEEFVDNFPLSSNRSVIINGFENYCCRLKNLCHQKIFLTQWIDGSFTTAKQEPQDIDLATHLDAIQFDQLIDYSQFEPEFEHSKIKSECVCDTYYIPIYPKNDIRYQMTQYWINYWSNLFGKDRMGNKKGIVTMNDHIHQ